MSDNAATLSILSDTRGQMSVNALFVSLLILAVWGGALSMSIIGNVCEDLLLFDGRRSSARQWNDIFRIIKQQGAALDVSYLAQWVDVLGV